MQKPKQQLPGWSSLISDQSFAKLTIVDLLAFATLARCDSPKQFCEAMNSNPRSSTSLRMRVLKVFKALKSRDPTLKWDDFCNWPLDSRNDKTLTPNKIQRQREIVCSSEYKELAASMSEWLSGFERIIPSRSIKIGTTTFMKDSPERIAEAIADRNINVLYETLHIRSAQSQIALTNGSADVTFGSINAAYDEAEPHWKTEELVNLELEKSNCQCTMLWKAPYFIVTTDLNAPRTITMAEALASDTRVWFPAEGVVGDFVGKFCVDEHRINVERASPSAIKGHYPNAEITDARVGRIPQQIILQKSNMNPGEKIHWVCLMEVALKCEDNNKGKLRARLIVDAPQIAVIAAFRRSSEDERWKQNYVDEYWEMITKVLPDIRQLRRRQLRSLIGLILDDDAHVRERAWKVTGLDNEVS